MWHMHRPFFIRENDFEENYRKRQMQMPTVQFKGRNISRNQAENGTPKSTYKESDTIFRVNVAHR